MAILMQETGRIPQAEAYFASALAILERSVGPRHQLTAFTRANYADFLRLAGHLDEALPLAEAAFRDLRQELPPGHRYVCWGREVLKNARKGSKK